MNLSSLQGPIWAFGGFFNLAQGYLGGAVKVLQTELPPPFNTYSTMTKFYYFKRENTLIVLGDALWNGWRIFYESNLNLFSVVLSKQGCRINANITS